MNLNIYALKDVKSGFLSPFTFANDELAIRYYKNSLQSPTPSLISMNPEDFELWKLGEINTDTGIIVPGLDFVSNSVIK